LRRSTSTITKGKDMSRFLPHCAAALLLALGAGSAAAQTPAPRWYVAVVGGASFLNEPNLSYNTGSGSTSGNLGLDTGWLVGGAVGGYLLPDVRLEGELVWRRNGVSSTSLAGFDPRPGDGDYASLILMANVYKDFDAGMLGGGRLKPYLGAGLGYAQEVDIDLLSGGSEREFSGSRFAYQLLGGVNWHFGGGWFAGAGLRWVDAGTVTLKAVSPAVGEIDARYRGWSVDLRLGYSF
jgi:opacity protein-like surface antigen